MQSGRPVLIVPSEGLLEIDAKAVIAWDGSREAVRAMHDGLPLLRLARSVDVVAVQAQRDDDDLDLGGLVAHLARHGIAAAARVVRATSPEAAPALLQNVQNGKYGLMIMGAYSHPRWQEFIFGGTTLSTLLHSNIPVLVSH
jgi:nucleotide-binding universal stress UspA family protein